MDRKDYKLIGREEEWRKGMKEGFFGVLDDPKLDFWVIFPCLFLNPGKNQQEKIVRIS